MLLHIYDICIHKYDMHITEIEIWNIDIVLNINYHAPCPMYILCIYILRFHTCYCKNIYVQYLLCFFYLFSESAKKVIAFESIQLYES